MGRLPRVWSCRSHAVGIGCKDDGDKPLGYGLGRPQHVAYPLVGVYAPQRYGHKPLGCA